MGLVYAELSLSNPSKPELQAMNIKALVDSGALHLCIPEHLAIQLKLKELEKREVTLADSKKSYALIVGQLWLNSKPVLAL